MTHMKAGLFAMLALFGLVYVVAWIAARRRLAAGQIEGEPAGGRPTAVEVGVGFVTNFFDTLGIGSFAPTTSVFKLWKMVPDRLIPGTLNIGHTPPTVAQALIFIAIIEVDMATLLLMIAAAVLGAWLGAGIVAGWPRRRVQIGMGGALLVAATLMLMANLALFPVGGETLHLEGWRLLAGVAGNVALGALMTLGIGLYAPCMILVSLLAMNPKAAFPIMMGSCAFLMPVASIRFLRAGSYARRPALGLAVGGVPAVLLAAFVVKELPLVAVRWLVVGVVVYAAVAMLRSALGGRDAGLRATASARESEG